MKEFIIPNTVLKTYEHAHIDMMNLNYSHDGILPYKGEECVNVDTGESLKSYNILEKIEPSGRMRSWASKEPWTVQWLRETLKREHVFWDIGACIGVYTLMASKLLGCKKVIAFEPVPQNYCELTDNITLNDCKNVEPYHVAITDKNGFSDWSFLPLAGVGNSRSGTGSHTCKIQNYTMDHLVFELGFEQPDIIKIDTDGTESDDIINGGLRTLRNVSGIMIEILGEPWDFPFHGKMIDLGFELDMDYYESVRRARQTRTIPILREVVELFYTK